MRFRIYALIATISLFASGTSRAGVMNGGFESGAFGPGWTSIGATDVKSVATFAGTPTGSGTFHALMDTSTSGGPNGGGAVSDVALETFLGLAVGTLDALSAGDVTEGSAIKQTLTVSAGDSLSFDWNFLTNEDTPDFFNDMAFYSITDGTGAVLIADTFSAGFSGSGTVFDEETGYNSVWIHIYIFGHLHVGVRCCQRE